RVEIADFISHLLGVAPRSQFKTAAAMRAYHQQHPFDFGITLGDNLYGRGPLSFAGRSGVATPDDSRWQTRWEQLYGPMRIKFYLVFGHADYFDPMVQPPSWITRIKA